VPNHLTAGDRCPHCGITFDYDETNGKRTPTSVIGGIVGITVAVIVGIARMMMMRNSD